MLYKGTMFRVEDIDYEEEELRSRSILPDDASSDAYFMRKVCTR